MSYKFLDLLDDWEATLEELDKIAWKIRNGTETVGRMLAKAYQAYDAPELAERNVALITFLLVLKLSGLLR